MPLKQIEPLPAPGVENQASGVPHAAPWLIALTALTRAPLLGPYLGEPDSGLFPIGLWRWVQAGPHAPRIYDRLFSPGYYWIGARLTAWLHLHFASFLPTLNVMSFLASLATAALAWKLARLWLEPQAAFWATLLFLLSPAIWWLGIEPHPQGPAIALDLAAVYLFVRCGRGWRRMLAWPALVAALLLRSDAVFLFPVFLIVAGQEGPGFGGTARPQRARARALLETAFFLAAAAFAFLALRSVLLHQSILGAQDASWRRILGYAGGLQWSHQLLPVLTAPGLFTLLWTGAGVLLGLWHSPRRWSRRWLPLLLAWTLPGECFWLLVRGNNVRHVALYFLPWLWAAAEEWARQGRRQRSFRLFPGTVLAAIALNFALPATSNVTLYPSGNVFLAAHRLRRREMQLRGYAAELLRRSRQAHVRYFGSYTTPYLVFDSLEMLPTGPHGNPRTNFNSAGPRLRLSPSLVFQDLYSARAYLQARRQFRNAFSLEYNARGQRRHVFGWRSQAPGS